MQWTSFKRLCWSLGMRAMICWYRGPIEQSKLSKVSSANLGPLALGTAACQVHELPKMLPGGVQQVKGEKVSIHNDQLLGDAHAVVVEDVH